MNALSEVIDSQEALNLSIDPDFSLVIGDIQVDVEEILTDGITVWANCEVSLSSGNGILRPLFCSDKSDPYYTPLEDYNSPVYFVSCLPSLDRKYYGYEEIGIDDHQTSMNLITKWVPPTSVHRYMSINTESETVEIWFRIDVKISDPAVSNIECRSIEFVLEVPLCGEIQICSFSTTDSFPDAYVLSPAFVFVQTPYMNYLVHNEKKDPTSPTMHWSIYDDVEGNLSPYAAFDRIPDTLVYSIYGNEPCYELLYEVHLVRNGDHYVVESQIFPE